MLKKRRKNHPYGFTYTSLSCSICEFPIHSINRSSNFCPNCGESLKKDFPHGEYYSYLNSIDPDWKIFSLKNLELKLIERFKISSKLAELLVTNWAS